MYVEFCGYKFHDKDLGLVWLMCCGLSPILILVPAIVDILSRVGPLVFSVSYNSRDEPMAHA